jgi:pre-mRNA-splicing factor SPF27
MPVLDGLLYIDREYDDESVKAQVDALITWEMQAMAAEGIKHKDYLETSVRPMRLSLILQQEYERVAQERKQTPLNMSRYDLEPPSGALAEDAQAWRKAIANARVMHSHQENRLLNLHLLDSHASKAWLIHNKQLDGIQRHLEEAVKRTKDSIECVNLKRKMEQEAHWSTLHNTRISAQALRHKSLRLAGVVRQLEDAVKHARIEAQPGESQASNTERMGVVETTTVS